MNYEYSDRVILAGELMKYRRSLCEETAKSSKCKKCPAFIKETGKCSLSTVINLLRFGRIN